MTTETSKKTTSQIIAGGMLSGVIGVIGFEIGSYGLFNGVPFLYVPAAILMGLAVYLFVK